MTVVVDWAHLPMEILTQIFSFCHHTDLCRVSVVHSHWRLAAQDDSVWKRLFLRSWGHFSFAQPFLVPFAAPATAGHYSPPYAQAEDEAEDEVKGKRPFASLSSSSLVALGQHFPNASATDLRGNDWRISQKQQQQLLKTVLSEPRRHPAQLPWKKRYAMLWNMVFNVTRWPGHIEAFQDGLEPPMVPKVLHLFASRAFFEETLARTSVSLACFSEHFSGPPPALVSAPPPPTPSSRNLSLSSSPLFPFDAASIISPSALSNSLTSAQPRHTRLLPPSVSWKVVSEVQGQPRTFEVLILEDNDYQPNGIPIIGSGVAAASSSSFPGSGSYQSLASFSGSLGSTRTAVDFEKAIREALFHCDMLVFVSSLETRLSSSSIKILDTLKGFLVPPPSAPSSTTSSLSCSPVFQFSLPSSPGSGSPLSSSPTLTPTHQALSLPSSSSSRHFVSPLYVDCDASEFSHYFLDLKRKLPPCDISYFWTYEAITRGIYDRSFMSAIKGGSFRFSSPAFPFLSVYQNGLFFSSSCDFRWVFQPRDLLLSGSFFFQGRFFDRITDSQVAFEFNGWPYLSENTKREMALKYVKEILFPHLTILETPSKDFRDILAPFKPSFFAPKAKIVRGDTSMAGWERDSSDSESETSISSFVTSSSSSPLISRTRRSSSLNITGRTSSGTVVSPSTIVVKCWLTYTHVFSSGILNANQYQGHIYLQITTAFDVATGRIRSITTDKSLLGSDFGFPVFESVTEWNPVKRDRFPRINLFM